MNYLFIFFFLILFKYSLTQIQIKHNFLLDNPQDQTHKIYFKKKIALSGGLFLLLSLILLNFTINISFLTILIFSLIPFLILGYFSDIEPKFSPKKRLFYQIFLTLLFIYLNQLIISKSGIIFIDHFIGNVFFNYVFTCLCIIVLLNGSNFCDGVNCNVTGYYLGILIIMILNSNENLDLETYLILILIVIYLFNFFQRSFLGDNGIYILSILMSLIIIKYINNNLNNTSPLLALNLLWYPAFENLFTILRRLSSGKYLDKPDKLHLHILLYKFLKTKKNDFNSNTSAGILLNIYNFFSITISFFLKDKNQLLALILIVNILVYIFIYFKLISILRRKKEIN